MNKLILVGNGFDLAHGLPTSYKDFIDDFWYSLSKKHQNQKVIAINEEFGSFFKYEGKEALSFDDLIINIKAFCNEYEPTFTIDNYIAKYGNKVIFGFKNDFFKLINTKRLIENWVDIENEYYSELKIIAKLLNLDISKSEDDHSKKKKEQVVKLNKEFEEVKNLFEQYLLNEIVKKFDFNNLETVKEFHKISELLKPIIIKKGPYSKSKILDLSKEFSYPDDEKEIKNYEKSSLLKTDLDTIIFQSLILSFNYTSTIFSYNYFINRNFGRDICSYNYIHGELNSEKNKINFGFGDEIDDSYKEIQDIGDNEYLKNFKSFQYSNTQNYDDLLRYIDSEKYQVYILGHSCGLSDRVLLNTIFEHKNCRSIKVYFHEKENEDNYTDIVQNISRHFDDKPSMRRKIVNKTLCSPLPQTVRFKKK